MYIHTILVKVPRFLVSGEFLEKSVQILLLPYVTRMKSIFLLFHPTYQRFWPWGRKEKVGDGIHIGSGLYHVKEILKNFSQILRDSNFSLKLKILEKMVLFFLKMLLSFNFFSAHTPSFPSNTSVNSYSRRRSTSHSTPNSPTKTSRSRSEAFCTCMTTDPTLIGSKFAPYGKSVAYATYPALIGR